MNAALSFINLPFYSKQSKQVSQKSACQISSVFQDKKVAELSKPKENKFELSQLPVVCQQDDTKQNIYHQTENNNNQFNSQNARDYIEFNQNFIQTEYSNKIKDLNLEPSNNLNSTNNNNTSTILIINNTSTKNEYNQGNLMAAYSKSEQNPIIETLIQSSPAATSTPNPIQQQQQNLLDQDIITNIFFKFDPIQLLQQKDQLNLIATTLASSISSNTTGKLKIQTSGDINNIVQSKNLNSFYSLLDNKKSINSEKQDEAQDIVENTSLNNNMASQQNNQNQFIKVSMTASSQLNQTQKWGQQIMHQQNQHTLFQQQHQQNNPQQYQLMNSMQQQQFHQQQIHQQMQHQQQLQIQLQIQQQKSAIQALTNPNNILNESTSSSNDGGDHNSSGGANKVGTGNERPYKCSQVHLNQHGRIHSGERPYGCDYCEKRFTQLSHLWQHRRRHTGERPYKCDVGSCDKSFTQLSNLQSHIKTHGNQSLSTTQSNDASMVSAIATVAALSCSKPTPFSQLGSISSERSNAGKSKRSRGNNELNSPNKRHFCELCNKYFATEGVITKHHYSHQQNEALLVRNADGSLIIKAINSVSNNK